MVERMLDTDHPEVEIIEEDPLRNETVVAENVTFEEFLTRFSEQHAEWIDGKVIIVKLQNTRHHQMLGFLCSVFNLFMGFKGGIGQVLLAGVPMRLPNVKPAREPDLLIVLNEHSERIKQNFVEGSADIVVEIVSPESTQRDRGDKLHEYEKGGVPEYWLLDPQRTESTVYALGDDGRYHPLPLDSEGRLVSRILPGFAIHPTLLWNETLPNGAEQVELVQAMINQR